MVIYICKLTFMSMDGLYFAKSHGWRCDFCLELSDLRGNLSRYGNLSGTIE